MKILRKIIDFCTPRRQAVLQTENTDVACKGSETFADPPLVIENIELGRRDFEKVISLGAVALPAFVSEASLIEITEAAGSLFARAGVGAGEANLLKGVLEWGLSQFAPEFTFVLPNERNFRTSTTKSLFHGVSKRSMDFPMAELLKLKNNLPFLQRAAQGEKILPGGHMPQEDVPGPWAGGYPVNYEHVVACPYCLGKWAESWFEMMPQYRKLLESYTESIGKIKNALPTLSKQGILESTGQFYRALKGKKESFYYPPSDDHMSGVLADDYLKDLESYIKRTPIEQLKKSFDGILDAELSSLKSWYADLKAAIDEVKELPGLLKRIKPYATAQDQELVSETEKKLKDDLQKSLQGQEGRFVILETQTFDIIDDFALIKQVIDSDPFLYGKLKVEKLSRERIEIEKTFSTLRDLPAIIDELPMQLDRFVKTVTESPEDLLKKVETQETFSATDMKSLLDEFTRFSESHELVIYDEWPIKAMEVAVLHARENPGQKLGIAFPANHKNIPGMARWYAGEIYLFNLIAEELYFNFGVEVSFMYSFEHEHDKTTDDKYIRKQQTYSNYLCQWARNGEVGVNVVHANLAVGEGLYEQLRIRYGKKPFKVSSAFANPVNKQ